MPVGIRCYRICCCCRKSVDKTGDVRMKKIALMFQKQPSGKSFGCRKIVLQKRIFSVTERFRIFFYETSENRYSDFLRRFTARRMFTGGRR